MRIVTNTPGAARKYPRRFAALCLLVVCAGIALLLGEVAETALFLAIASLVATHIALLRQRDITSEIEARLSRLEE